MDEGPALPAFSVGENYLLDVVLNHFQKEVPVYASFIQSLRAMTGANGEPTDIQQLVPRAREAGVQKTRMRGRLRC